MSARPTDDLYVRYMDAFKTSSEHIAACPACQADQPCTAGRPIHERFHRLQDAYNNRQKQQR
ncbi:hypothetical protein ABT127_29525 [Streptomyces sp. NPDC001904]|uniref:hypothetical protein n=1 Tax=Streptomyces sp. NPDC001904 TaxID=3154531 RepID=UPI003329387B